MESQTKIDAKKPKDIEDIKKEFIQSVTDVSKAIDVINAHILGIVSHKPELPKNEILKMTVIGNGKKYKETLDNLVNFYRETSAIITVFENYEFPSEYMIWSGEERHKWWVDFCEYMTKKEDENRKKETINEKKNDQFEKENTSKK